MAFTFGAQPAQQPSGSLFGSTATTQQPAQQSSGLFGASTAPKPAGTGLFGSATAPTGAGGTGGGLFGGGAGVGNTPTTAPSTSLFGAPPATQQSTGGLFGSTLGQQSQQQQQTGAGGGLFGATQQPQQSAAGTGTGTGLFGSTTQQMSGQPSTGLFGAAQQQQPAAGGPGVSLFGASKPAGQTSLFGSSAQAPAPGTGLFGATQQPQSQQSVVGGTGLFGSTLGQSQIQPQQQQMGVQNQQQLQGQGGLKGDDIEAKMMAVQQAWDPSNPNCHFKYFFYNVVEPGSAAHYGRPAGATDDARWARAVRDNPDPSSMVPVLAIGWTDVKKRVQAQEQTASVHQQRVKELNQALEKLTRQTSLSSSIRLSALQSQLNQLTQRLLHLAAQVPSFTPVASAVFKPEEAELKESLEHVNAEIEGRVKKNVSGSGLVGSRGLGGSVGGIGGGVGKGRMIGQINELWGMIEEVRRQRRARPDQGQVWMGDEKTLTEIAVILDQQQQALQKLNQLSKDALFDADVIRQGLGER